MFSANRWKLLLGSALLLTLLAWPLAVARRIPVLDPDEGIHAAIAQEMVEGGDWITPRFLGEPFRDKPILFFWAMAGSLATFGMNETAVRFPGLLCGLLGIATTGYVARRLFDRPTGWIATLLQASMILPTALMQSPVHDLALVPLTNLALLGFWLADRDRERAAASWRATALAGVALGLAALTKGLLGVAMVACPALAYLIVVRRLTPGICGRALAALALGALVAAPWYLAMSLRTPGYAHYFFVERHLHGYLTESQFHGKAPWWYYLPMLLGGGLPWIAYLPIALRQLWTDRWDRQDEAFRARVFGWCWLVVTVLFLSVANSKLVTYLLPTFPAISILAADLWSRCRRHELLPTLQQQLWWSFAFSSAAGVLVLPIATYFAARAFGLELSPWVWGLCLLVSCGSWLPLYFFPRRDVEACLGAGVVSLVIAFMFIMGTIVPRVAPVTSAVDLARHFNQVGKLPPRLLIAEERIGSFVFYLEPRLRAELRWDRLDNTRLRELAFHPVTTPGVLLAVPERSLHRAQSCLDLSAAKFVRAGRYRIYQAVDAKPLEKPLVARKP